VASEDALAELADALFGVKEFAVDVEASDIDSMRAVLAGISIAWIPGEAFYVPVSSMIEDGKPALDLASEAHGLKIETVRNFLGPVFKDPAVRKIGQNIKYDAIVLANAGMPLAGIAFDTMLASYSLNPSPRSHSLDSLASEFIGHEMIPFKSLFDSRSKKKDIRRVGLEKVCEYACEDADMTLRLKKIFDPLIGSSQVEKLFFEVEMPLSAVLTEMEQSGVKIDTGRLSNLSVEIEGKLETIQKAVFDEAGEKFNINSTQKLSEILFGKLGLKPVRKTKTGFSTDMDVLKTLADEHELPKLLLEYRTLSKLKNTYVDALPALINPATRRIHTSYNQAVTHTGRLSSSNPNLQNIPIRTPMGRRIRQAFTAGGKDWILLDADYSQVELRILAHLSRDVELIKAFQEDGDVHSRTAALIHHISPQKVTPDMRSRAKTVNFGIIYGMGPRGLAQALKMDFKEARDFINNYFECYPGVKRFIDSTIVRAREEKAISTLMGRIRQLPDIDSADNRTRAFAERVAVNTPVQGTAADIIKVAMVRIASEFKRRNLQARMILQVHDELLFDLPLDELEEVRKLITDMMESAIELDVPLKVDTGIGPDWLEAHG